MSFGANSVSSAQNSVSLLSNHRLRGTYRALCPEVGEGQKNSRSWVLETVLSETVFPTQSTPLSGGSPHFSTKHPQDNFSASKIQIDTLQHVNRGGGSLCNSIQKLQIGGRQSRFGGCRFAFWRASIPSLEAEIGLGVLYSEGEPPKRGVLWFSFEDLAVRSLSALTPLQQLVMPLGVGPS